MAVVKRTREYEAWLAGTIKVLPKDIALKHRLMAQSVFPFLRATFYRWVDLWREVCPDLAAAPEILAVGDLHVENFGTWRDAEGRLVWGINDFDEAAPMPYAIDLVRLATSALLAFGEGSLTIGSRAACAAILDGYAQGLAQGGQPFVLEEDHPGLRLLALSEERDPVRFWAKLTAVRPNVRPPAQIRRLLDRDLPARGLPFRTIHRVAGLGSLGRERYVALAAWHGGLVAHEAKALLPSAYSWAIGKPAKKIRYMRIIERAIRCPDPFVRVEEDWLLRRIGPHCSRIELSALPKRRDEARLLHAMGRETANIHHGTPEAVAAIRKDLTRRKPEWLLAAAQGMAEATTRDWKQWKAATR
jgi:uncharacterized protein (DUF2252 family)